MSKTWTPYYQFQSHDPEFDYLKSTEIEEKINQLKFSQPIGDKLFILSTNGEYLELSTLHRNLINIYTINLYVQWHTLHLCKYAFALLFYF
jgi:hypothetical protein